MSRQNLVRFNVGGRDPLNLFVVLQGGSFTVPTQKTVLSAVDPTLGGVNLGSVIPTVGGQILMATTDAGSGQLTTQVIDLTMGDVCDVRPGDVIALSAVATGFVTLTLTSVDGTVRTFKFATTTTATVVGFYA